MRARTPPPARHDAVHDEPLAPELIPVVVPLLALGPALVMFFVFWAVL